MIGAEAFLAEHGVAIPASEPDIARHAQPARRTDGRVMNDGRVLAGNRVVVDDGHVVPDGCVVGDDCVMDDSHVMADGSALVERHISTEHHASTERPALAGCRALVNLRALAGRRTDADSGMRGYEARPFSASVEDGSDDMDLDACREAALRLLDAAPRASGALRTRLLDKGYAEEIVDEVIERLTRVQLLDDEAYAQSAVRYCAGRMMGRRGASMELVRKGVSRSLAERVCAEAESNGVFEESAWELGRSVARKTRGLEPQTRKRRFWSAGGRKGHNPETLRTVAAELFS